VPFPTWQRAHYAERVVAAFPAAVRKLRQVQEAGIYVPPAGLEESRASFRAFLSRWKFIVREGRGRSVLGTNLWEGQDDIVRLVDDVGVRRLISMKGGKLGTSEMAAAYDGWRGCFAAPGSRVHLYSQTGDDAKTLLDIIRAGIRGLPHDWGFGIADDERYGDTTRSLKVRGPDGEIRSFWSYAPTKTASISESCVHAHVDELAHMQWGRDLYNSVVTIVPDDGTLWIISRGHGIENQHARLWEEICGDATLASYEAAHAAALERLKTDPTTLVPLFQPYTKRPGRSPEWRENQARTMTSAAIRWYAPETPEDSLAGNADEEFVPVEMWDGLDVVGPLEAGDVTPLVLALDAGVRDDYTALIGVTRHPERHDDVAVRFVHEWHPSPVLDFDSVRAQWRYYRDNFNLVCTAYDPYALDEMARDLGSEAYWERFDQGARRLLADKGLRDAIHQRRVARPPNGSTANDVLRSAIRAAGARSDKDESKLRIVKRASGKIDALVALSMARATSLALNL